MISYMYQVHLIFFSLAMSTLNRIVLKQLHDVPFILYKVEGSFSTHVAFSDAKFLLRPITNKSEGTALAVPFHVLYNFPPKLLDDPSTRPDALKESFEKLIKTVKNRAFIPPMDELDTFPAPPPSPSSRKLGKEDTMLNIAKYLILPLFGEADFEKKYQRLIGGLQGRIRLGSIRLGSKDTFHGAPDMRVQSCNIIWTPADLDDSCLTSYDLDGDDEDAISVQSMYERLVVASIVCSFTYSEDVLSMKATVLLGVNSFKVCLFDSVNDVLLISQSVKFYRADKNALSRSGALLLWIIMHDR